MNFKELTESREHNCIGIKLCNNACDAIELKQRLQDELKINVYAVPELELAGNRILFAYFVDDVSEDKIDRALEIMAIWCGKHDEFYDCILGEYASPEMIQILSAK